ncbi:MAG: hypothetical protein ACI4TW_05890 [Prevotella sp.]
MKKFLSLVVMLTALASAHAYEYPYLTFQKDDGTTVSMGVESLTLTIADGQLVAQNVDSYTTFTLTELSRMFFSNDPSGISDIANDAKSAAVEVFTTAGTRVGRFPNMAKAKENLSRGIYVIRTNGNALKTVIR